MHPAKGPGWLAASSAQSSCCSFMDWSLVVGAPFDVGPAFSQRAGLQRGETPLADKSSFTTEEWTLLLESPMLAGMAITAADPSGLWGLLKESFAGGSALTRAATSADTNALVKAVVTDFSTSDGRSAARDGLKQNLPAVSRRT